MLLDGNKEAEGKDYWGLGGTQHSPDHALLAYAVDENGSELFTSAFAIFARATIFPTSSPKRAATWLGPTTASISSMCASTTTTGLSRSSATSSERTRPRIRLVFEETSTGYYVGLSKTQSSRFITIDSHDHQSSEVYLVDANEPASPARLVEKRENGHEYSVEHHGGRLIITTNSGGAEDFRICEAPISSPGKDNWSELVPMCRDV